MSTEIYTCNVHIHLSIILPVPFNERRDIRITYFIWRIWGFLYWFETKHGFILLKCFVFSNHYLKLKLYEHPIPLFYARYTWRWTRVILIKFFLLQKTARNIYTHTHKHHFSTFINEFCPYNTVIKGICYGIICSLVCLIFS